MIETVATILTAVGTITASTFGLLKYYFRKQSKLDIARKELYQKQIDDLSSEIADLRSEVRHDLDEVLFQLQQMTQAYRDDKVAAEKVFIALGQFVLETKEKFKKYDSQLGKVEVKPDPAPNYGKIKVTE